MRTKFNKSWNKSKNPGKKRKYVANAPLHLKRNLLSVNLSKELRKKYATRNVPIRKGDTVEIMKGKFKKKKGKITQVFLKRAKVTIEKIQVTKQDGSKADVKLRPSNLRIVELNLDDRKRKIGNKKKELTKKIENKKIENKKLKDIKEKK
jgi:large subunit ribosomal protein L24